MKKIYTFVLVVMILTAVILLSPAVAGAEDFIRSAFVAHIDADKGIVSFVDSCGICWQWKTKEGEDISEYTLLDEFIFPLHGEKVTKCHMGKPVYSGIRVDRDWAIRVLILNHPHFVDDFYNNTGV